MANKVIFRNPNGDKCEIADLIAMKLDIIEDFVNKVVTTQETNKDVPLYGFYYEDVDHKYLLHYEHRGHEEYPVWGLISAYNLLEILRNEFMYFKYTTR